MTESQHEDTQLLSSDEDLLSAVRDGDTGAYAILYERHTAAAYGLARQLVREGEIDDIVAEAFTRVLGVVQRGGGPGDGFRPYLLTALRHVAYDRFRGEKRNVVTDDMERFDSAEPFVDPALEGLEQSLIARAFLSLPERWQAVLWHTEIERQKPAAVAPILGMKANGVAALAYRAREGLRQAYLQMHFANGTHAESCRPALERMGAYIRGGLARRDATSVRGHIDDCARCNAVYIELADINAGLRGIVLPLVVGPAGAAYLKSMGVGMFGGGLWWRRIPKRQKHAALAGSAVAVVLAASALAVVGNEESVRQEQRIAASPPVIEDEPETEPEPEAPDPPPDEPPAAPTPPTADPSPSDDPPAEPPPEPVEEPPSNDDPVGPPPGPEEPEESEEPEEPEDPPEEPEEPEDPPEDDSETCRPRGLTVTVDTSVTGNDVAVNVSIEASDCSE